MTDSIIIAYGLLACMMLMTLTSPYHPDLALVALNLAFAAGCGVESVLVWRGR